MVRAVRSWQFLGIAKIDVERRSPHVRFGAVANSHWLDYAIAKNPSITLMVATPWGKHLHQADTKMLDEKEEKVAVLDESARMVLAYTNSRDAFTKINCLASTTC